MPTGFLLISLVDLLDCFSYNAAMPSKNIVIAAIVFIASGVAGWYGAVWYEHYGSGGGQAIPGGNTALNQASSSASGSKSAIDLTNTKPGQEIKIGNGGIITVLPIDRSKLPPPPDLDRPFNWPAATKASPEVIATAKKDIDTLVAALKKDPGNYDDWVKLGTYWKIAGDLKGARIAWSYASKIHPTVPVAYSNLADLAGYYDHDYTKAKSYFALTLQNANGADAPFYYIKAAQFYLDIKDTSTALATLKQGLKVSPGSADLKKAIDLIQNSAGSQ